MNNTLAVDLDNVIAGTDPLIRQIIKRSCGIALSQEDIRTWHYADALVAQGLDATTAAQVEEDAFDEFHSGQCSQVEPIKGSVEALLSLATGGLDVLIITARPRTQPCEESTRAWLSHVHLPTSWLLMNNDKQSLCHEWVLLVDDAPHHAEQVATRGTQVLLFDYPWNRATLHPKVLRVSGWNDILKYITILITR